MKQAFFYFFIFLFFYTGSAQVNLVPNPSFENYTSCPTGVGQVNKAFPWIDPTGSTSDYFNSCSTTPGLPNNFGGFQYARTGNGYVGLNAYVSTWANFRDYIQVPLDSILQAGKEYCVIFYINLANNSKYGIDALGAYFSSTPITCAPPCILSYTAQINNTINNIITDTVNWIKIKGNFTAVGGEKYMTIGNFKDDTNTDTMLVYSGSPYEAAYYYIDDVSVMLCSDTAISVNEINGEDLKIKLFPNPSNGTIIVNYTIKQNDAAAIKIYDLRGELVEEYGLNSNKNELQLNTNLNNGIYLYQIIVNDKIVKGDKLVVIK